MKFIGVTLEDVQDGAIYKVSGSDWFGDWSEVARCRFYGKGSTKSQLAKRLRFVTAIGYEDVIHNVKVVESI